MGEGSTFLGDADLLYSAYASMGRENSGADKFVDLGAGGRVEVTLPLIDHIIIGASAYTGKQKLEETNQIITVDNSTVNQIAFQVMTENPSVDPTSAAFQALLGQRIQTWLAENASSPEYHSYSSTTQYDSREYVGGIDARFKWKGIKLQSEFNHNRLRNYKTDKYTGITGLYGLLSYETRPLSHLKITPYFLYERLMVTDADNNPQAMLSGTFMKASISTPWV